MTWRNARRLTAESNKRGDEFLKARDAWQKGPRSETLRQRCLEHAARYEEALNLEIEQLLSLDDCGEKTFALHRANLYKRLLERQLARIIAAVVA